MSRKEIVLAALVAALLAPPGFAQPRDFKIDAALFGYGLVGPTDRCCAFTLTLQANGNVVVVLELPFGPRPETKTYRYTVSQDDVRRVWAKIESSRFFDLPREVRDSIPVDGDERRVTAQRGVRRHAVLLGDPLHPTDARETRAAAVWLAIRRVMRIDERLDADPLPDK